MVFEQCSCDFFFNWIFYGMKLQLKFLALLRDYWISFNIQCVLGVRLRPYRADHRLQVHVQVTVCVCVLTCTFTSIR